MRWGMSAWFCPVQKATLGLRGPLVRSERKVKLARPVRKATLAAWEQRGRLEPLARPVPKAKLAAQVQLALLEHRAM